MIIKKQIIAKCDRCGAVVTSDTPKPFPGWGEIKARGDNLKIGISSTPGNLPYSDLCPDCWLDFSEWWRRERVQQAISRLERR